MARLGLALLALLVAFSPLAGGCRAAQDPAGIAIAALPAEARSMIRLIGRGGPYPYERDGTVFHNYEKQLPLRGTGYYREYTVSTPGARGRGARRIVAGRDGELYYTDDHYRTFRRVLVETVKGGR